MSNPSLPANPQAFFSASRPHLHLHRNLWWNKADELAAKGLAKHWEWPLETGPNHCSLPPVPFPSLYFTPNFQPFRATTSRQPLSLPSALSITSPNSTTKRLAIRSDQSLCRAGQIFVSGSKLHLWFSAALLHVTTAAESSIELVPD